MGDTMNDNLIQLFKIGVINELYSRKIITQEQRDICIQNIKLGKDVVKK